MVLYGGKTIPRWWTAAILKIDISPYLSETSSDFYEILYTAADFELDERHVIKNEKVALDRLRVWQNVFLVIEIYFCVIIVCSGCLLLLQVEERAKYGQVFETLRPVDGRLHGDKVRPVSLCVYSWQAQNVFDWLLSAWEMSRHNDVKLEQLVAGEVIWRWCVLCQVLMNSKLPVDVLGRIWELSDIDNDGFLDCDEFILVWTCCVIQCVLWLYRYS